MRRRALVVLLLTLSAGLSGCFGVPENGGDNDGEPTVADWPRCAHPYPCGDGSEWPANLTGPFDLLPVEPATVESHDGTLLDGGIWRPDLPGGVGAPVLLQTTPYLGTCSYQSIGLDPDCKTSPRHEDRIQGISVSEDLIAEGYAVAIFSVRGTGGSGGCYDSLGLDEQLDQVALVEWLADQEWSNGRVAMTGLSYSGTTPLEAAIHTPEALKAIAVGGIVTDLYLGAASPQGAIRLGAGLFQAGTAAANSLQPPVSGFGSYAPVASERLCPGVADVLTVVQQAETTDDRNEAWFQERRLVDRFGDVESAVLVMHGFQDATFHRYQEDIIWDALPNAPKAFLLGQWGHTVSGLAQHMDQYEHGEGWHDLALRWYDFWLKGLGDPPSRLGNVDYEVSDGTWRNDTAWPPTAAREEALHLSGETLSPAKGGDGRSLDITPIDDDHTSCVDDPAVSPNDAPHQLVFAAEPATTETVIAGNPYALLEITASEPRGLFGADLFVAGPSWSCEGGGELSFLTRAEVDLRFHAGNMQGTDFPTDAPTVVRMDFYNIAHHIEPGQRLVLILRNGDGLMGQHATSALTVHGTSQLVVPLIDGSLGGVAPPEDAPPRPFLPSL